MTQSKNYDYHKLNMTLQVYRLGSSYVDLAAAGQDDLLQLGNEESYAHMLEISKAIANNESA